MAYSAHVIVSAGFMSCARLFHPSMFHSLAYYVMYEIICRQLYNTIFTVGSAAPQ